MRNKHVIAYSSTLSNLFPFSLTEFLRKEVLDTFQKHPVHFGLMEKVLWGPKQNSVKKAENKPFAARHSQNRFETAEMHWGKKNNANYHDFNWLNWAVCLVPVQPLVSSMVVFYWVNN